MSYQSFAKQEMELAHVAAPVQDLVLKVLDVIDGQGHSGASIDIYSNMLKRWFRKNGQREMPEDLWAVLKDSDPETNVDVLMTVHQLIRFEPLTPLTGKDDEWIDQSGPTGSPLFQNRRCPTVFKDEHEKAYHIGVHLYGYPAKNYTGWHLVDRGRALSAFEICSFPYSSVDCPSYNSYYLQDDWEEQFPTGIDPTEWLKWMREQYLKGIDPKTSLVRSEVVFVNLDECCDLTKDLRAVLCYLKYNWKTVTRDQVIDRLGWLADYKEPFEMRWTEPKSEADGDTDHHVTLTDSRRGAQLLRTFMIMPTSDIDYMVGMEDSLIAPMLIDKNGIEYALCFRPVMVTDARFQFWKQNGAYVPVFSDNLLVEKFYFHDGYKITGDQEEYLFQKRREHGYAHPRGRNQLHVKIADDCTDPATIVNAVVTAYRASDMSKEEGEQIDNVVSKHVKKVFGTDKKD